jgi:N-methylhydantoinase B
MKIRFDPIQLQIFNAIFASIAEEMGMTLKRTAFSPNIKERRDYSCALFDYHGRLAAQGEHMPVHLGSMPESVRAAINSAAMEPGDVVILNDPYAGGTHLPDITLVSPVFSGKSVRRPDFFVANRAHHSDVGGMTSGSMPLSRDLFQEGIRIPPVKLYSRGVLNADLLRLILSNVRTSTEREGDLTAQIAANRTGERRILEVCARHGLRTVSAYMLEAQRYTARSVSARLRQIADGDYLAEDFMDDDGLGAGPLRLAVRVSKQGGRVVVDFSGTCGQVAGGINAVHAITLSAVFYVIKCLCPPEVPSNAGILDPIRVMVPEGSLLNARFPAAVAGGNVETSQRIVDVLLRALAQAVPSAISAASSGTMNNIALGGIHPQTGRAFTYYETVAGGMGAGPEGPGDNGIHTHMTNSLNTPIEALEHSLPLRVNRYRLRRGSGGPGRYPGGDGIERELQFLTDADVTLLSDRRIYPPYGLAGGGPGRCGENWWISGESAKSLPGKIQFRIPAGDRLLVCTPGGGGWGRAREQGTGNRE